MAPPAANEKRNSAEGKAKLRALSEKNGVDYEEIFQEFEPGEIFKREKEEKKRVIKFTEDELAYKRRDRDTLEKVYGIAPKGPLEDEVVEDDDEKEQTLAEQWESFNKDEENWKEGDLDEEWVDPPKHQVGSYYDPKVGVTGVEEVEEDEDEDARRSSRRRGRSAKRKEKGLKVPKEIRTPDVYVPFRRDYPPIPETDSDIDGPEDVIDNMAGQEEFLDWDSCVFKDGSTYEGTVFNDLAQGKGVYTTGHGLCSYEGEWAQNMMQGHGVASVIIPKRVAAPDSELEKKTGPPVEDILMTEEERQWLKMELEDLDNLGKLSDTWEKMTKENAEKEPKGDDDEELAPREKPFMDGVPFWEKPAWLKTFGRLPPKGRYKYSGQMKHNRMHGCGVYELNGRMVSGRWYFGELVKDEQECDAQACAFHAGMGEVAAAKARMFSQKPDGMVRERFGPYNDPSHPYFYEDADMWMAPGFVNEFHPVPSTWAQYVEEVDKEQEMWLNSFIQSPFRIPMPAELEHEWNKEEEFVILGNASYPESGGSEPGAERWDHPALQGKVLLHVPSKQIINWAEDDKGKLRFFIQPFEPGQPVDISKAQLLPLGFDDFMADLDLVDEADEAAQADEGHVAARERRKKLRERRWAEEDALREAQKALEEAEKKKDDLKKQIEAQKELGQKTEDLLRDLELRDEALVLRQEALIAAAGRLLTPKGKEEGKAKEEKKGDVAGKAVPAPAVKEKGTSEPAKPVVAESVKEKEAVQLAAPEENKSAPVKEAPSVKATPSDPFSVDVIEEEEEETVDEVETPSKEEASSGASQEEEGEEEADDEEEEDDKKPRSFGTVAMADTPSVAQQRGAEGRGAEAKGSQRPFPTAFASLSLASQGTFQHVLTHVLGAASAAAVHLRPRLAAPSQLRVPPLGSWPSAITASRPSRCTAARAGSLPAADTSSVSVVKECHRAAAFVKFTPRVIPFNELSLSARHRVTAKSVVGRQRGSRGLQQGGVARRARRSAVSKTQIQAQSLEASRPLRETALSGMRVQGAFAEKSGVERKHGGRQAGIVGTHYARGASAGGMDVLVLALPTKRVGGEAGVDTIPSTFEGDDYYLD
eukprot:TRINITY_DN91_c0_g1_i2.p1 TRINITY_DN91_c0_g1~~TRINITY_DN91_c0_g1_i2.p1  ORF type:complete len:1099 (+),score=321.61 TRINITY_DN91_c0_g1_i2:88-3384(+)